MKDHLKNNKQQIQKCVDDIPLIFQKDILQGENPLMFVSLGINYLSDCKTLTRNSPSNLQRQVNLVLAKLFLYYLWHNIQYTNRRNNPSNNIMSLLKKERHNWPTRLVAIYYHHNYFQCLPFPLILYSSRLTRSGV